MNPYVMPVYCEVCGGEGMAHANAPSPYSSHRKFGAPFFSHKDPRECAANIKARETKKRELLKRNQELERELAELKGQVDSSMR